MAAYKSIIFEKAAKKFIVKQIPEQQKRLLKAISRLPENGDIKKLKGYSSLYRLRVGDYRVLYTVDTDDQYTIVTVSNVDNRGQVYK
ncbi:MAG: type II toxin-antitoxin system RelE/ParE family toxin [Oscillospiraceae bacterium]|nr:type II toxin-antitoxin system RelE/ParE family toxin [Oscillospiraceae bacterium]